MDKISEETDLQRDTTLCMAATRSAPHGLSTLLSLPRELRDEIYNYLLASGQLQILRTSRLLGQKAQEILYNKVTLRIRGNSVYYFRNIKSIENVTDRIQDVQLEWDLGDPVWPRTIATRSCHWDMRFEILQAQMTEMALVACHHLHPQRKDTQVIVMRSCPIKQFSSSSQSNPRFVFVQAFLET